MVYSYSGPVQVFDKPAGYICNYETTAASKAKAKSNIEYRVKTEMNLLPNARVKIDGTKIKEVQ